MIENNVSQVKTQPETTSKAGRKPKYSVELNNQAYEYCLLGATEKELAAYLGISVATLNVWKHQYPEFLESIKKGKKPADAKVAHAIFDRATGAKWMQQQAFKVKETTYGDNGKKVSEIERIEIVDIEMAAPPDTTACIFILKNRDKENWKDKQEFSLSGSLVDVPYSTLSDKQKAAICAANEALAEAGE